MSQIYYLLEGAFAREITVFSVIFQAFGAPTIVTTDSSNATQMVFGSDRFNILADILEQKYDGPLAELNKAKL